MRELKQLRLPQLVEARKKRESMHNDSTDAALGHPLQPSLSSSSTDAVSPKTPTFAVRGHTRISSSGSSLASSPPMRDSIDGFGKRPLTEVREEPHEPEDDYHMINGFSNSPPDPNGKFALPSLPCTRTWRLMET